MRRSRFHNTALRSVSAVFLVVVLLAGCSESPVSVTENDSQPRLLSRSASLSSPAELSPLNLYVEKVISSENGGELSLFDVSMTVPAGAVPNDTLFSISIPDINVFYNEFGTDGLVFDRPVTVTMSYRDADLTGVDESTIRIAYFNNATGWFEDVLCEVDFENKEVTAQLNHFSAYGLISD